MGIFIIIFIMLYAYFCIAEFYNARIKSAILVAFCLILACIVGFRSNLWADTSAYLYAFNYWTDNLLNYSFNTVPVGYSEKGFYLLSCVIKSFTSNSTAYLTIVSLLTFFFLYKSLSAYGIYPLIGIMVYISRFIISRNFMQIRAALAIALAFYATSFLKEKGNKDNVFLILVLLASTLHSSILLFLFLWFLKNRHFSNKVIFFSIVATLLFVYVNFTLIQSYTALLVANIDDISNKNISGTYVSENSIYSHGQGLANPLIYYQTILLFSFCFFDNKLRASEFRYNLIKNAYFMSTMLLILFSPFATLSGRTSTTLATFEILILPSLIGLGSRKYLVLTSILVGVVSLLLLYMNLLKLDFLL